jgi:hypothetical protein
MCFDGLLVVRRSEPDPHRPTRVDLALLRHQLSTHTYPPTVAAEWLIVQTLDHSGDLGLPAGREALQLLCGLKEHDARAFRKSDSCRSKIRL